MLLAEGAGTTVGASDLAIVAAAAVGWLLVSRVAAGRNVSAAMALVALGALLANGPWAVIDVQVRSESIRLLAEATLALVLFSDASRVNFKRLEHDAGVPARLLLIGLPLTIGLGMVVGAGLLGGSTLWVGATIAAIVAPTDAALGAPIVNDERVPNRIRRTLNVESGLNDGIATPFVNLLLAAAVAGAFGSSGGMRTAVASLAIGAVGGAAIGWAGGTVSRRAHAGGWMEGRARPLVALLLAVLAYTATVALDGNGFIAAFVAGLAFGTTISDTEAEVTSLTEEVGEGMTLVVWFVVGAVMLVPALEAVGWREVAFAVLALTVVRMVPVALALIGTGLDRTTVAFIGWFGPRGLASVVFTLIAVDALDSSDAERVLAAGILTVLLSVIAHGITASPFARRYGAHAKAHGIGGAVDHLRTRRPHGAPRPTA